MGAAVVDLNMAPTTTSSGLFRRQREHRPSYTGRVSAFLDPLSGALDTDSGDATWDGDLYYERIGRTLDNAGDVDGTATTI